MSPGVLDFSVQLEIALYRAATEISRALMPYAPLGTALLVVYLVGTIAGYLYTVLGFAR